MSAPDRGVNDFCRCCYKVPRGVRWQATAHLHKKKPPPKAGAPKPHGVVPLLPTDEVFPHFHNLGLPTGTVPVSSRCFAACPEKHACLVGKQFSCLGEVCLQVSPVSITGKKIFKVPEGLWLLSRPTPKASALPNCATLTDTND